MKHAKIPLVTAGGDWAGVMNIHAGQIGNGVTHHGVEQTRARVRLASIMFVLVFAVLAGRLAQLTLAEDPQLARVGTTDRETDVQRPAITDRNGVVLASQIYLTTLGANASEIQNGDAIAAQLTEILPNMNAQRARRLLAGDRHYVELIKGLTPLQKRAVLELGNPGLKLRREAQRVYPSGSVASHVVGFSSTDMQGLMGLERRLDEQVQMLPIFATTLDIRVQHAVRESLSAAIGKFSAKGGGAILMDATNGEILALVSLPDFDINRPSATLSRHFNAMTMGVYELGSIFKVMTAAMALESGEVRLDETFDTGAPLEIGAATINDAHGEKRRSPRAKLSSIRRISDRCNWRCACRMSPITTLWRNLVSPSACNLSCPKPAHRSCPCVGRISSGQRPPSVTVFPSRRCMRWLPAQRW